jgi:hypothetical protein
MCWSEAPIKERREKKIYIQIHIHNQEKLALAVLTELLS